MIPGSANFAGMNEAQRNAIVQALLAQQGVPAPAPDAPFLNPYQDIVDPSDPASYDSTLGEVVAGFPDPTVSLNPGDLVEQNPQSTLEAPTPEQQMQGLPEPDPGDPDNIGTLEAPSPNQQFSDMLDQMNPDTNPDPNAPAPPDVDANTGVISGDQGAAIAADVAGLTGLNAAVNDAVAGYAVDQGFSSDPGGFGGITADGAAIAADVAGSLSDMSAAVSDAVAGYDSSSGESGTGEGGGSSGGDGGK